MSSVNKLIFLSMVSKFWLVGTSNVIHCIYKCKLFVGE